VENDLERALSQGVEAIALATSSRFAQVVPALETAIRRRVHVVSTCEELAAPVVDRVRWARLDAHAKNADVTVLGTGVNPGFVMDRLVLALGGACVRVDAVSVKRVVDAAHRRGPLRKKIGEGLTVADWQARAKEGLIGHVGLRESVTLIAHGLRWPLERVDERLEPVVAEDGHCLGLHQEARGIVDGKERIVLDLSMVVGAKDPHDRVVLTADPPIDARLEGGVHGDRGTIGTIVNALCRLRSAPRGLVTVADVFV
jgi:4-hydroxy-tetrahydrodipicolinate reductase